MLFENLDFAQRGKENTLFQINRCIIDMLCNLIYVKKYENIFYSIIRAKLKI